MPSLSAVLITLDEEHRLAEALDSLRFCDERVVVDGGSTDRTRQIAEEGGARFILNAPFPGFVEQRRFAVAQARHDWVLALDADERVSPELAQEIRRELSGEPRVAAYSIPRAARYLGTEIRFTDWYPDRQIRLFDRRHSRWEGGRIHESVRVDGALGRLKGDLEHHPYSDLSAHLRKIDRYTTLWAEDAWERGQRASWLKLVGAPAWNFLRNYVLRGGFRLGRVGFTISALNAHYTHVKLAKLLEREKTGRATSSS